MHKAKQSACVCLCKSFLKFTDQVVSSMHSSLVLRKVQVPRQPEILPIFSLSPHPHRTKETEMLSCHQDTPLPSIVVTLVLQAHLIGW
mmetsp:Transcript_6105/g.6831  ORF Transcript_6105/g.6831 Transcript_6105/m.6831 type:complete len:88 (-) Transcript_6105:1021-1284(-)